MIERETRERIDVLYIRNTRGTMCSVLDMDFFVKILYVCDREYLPHMQTYDMIPYDLLLGLPFVSSRAETFSSALLVVVCLYILS